MKPLVDLTSRALARMIEGKSPEEIRETFNLPDDLSPEEKLEPILQGSRDPRIKLLNRLYAKKRQVGSNTRDCAAHSQGSARCYVIINITFCRHPSIGVSADGA